VIDELTAEEVIRRIAEKARRAREICEAHHVLLKKPDVPLDAPVHEFHGEHVEQ